MRSSRVPFQSAALLLLILILATVLPEPIRASVRIVDHGDSHLRLKYEADGPSWMDSEQRCLLGIPSRGEVAFELVEVVDGALLHLSTAEARELDANFVLLGPVHLGKPGRMRDQRVVNLLFSPRLTPEGRLQTYDRVVVDLYFANNGGDRQRPDLDPWEEELYLGSLLNYHQARRWRIPRIVPASRTGQADGNVQKVRLTLRDEGIYQITADDLAELGLDLSLLDPARLRLLYGGGEILSEPQSQSGKEVRLEEQPMVVESGSDGSFDADDYLLFAAESVSRWERDASDYKFTANPYTLDNVYWLEIGHSRPGVRTLQRSGEPVVERSLIDSYRARLHRESENQVYAQPYGIKSGYDWYWEDFDGNSRSYPVQVEGAAPGNVDIRLGFFGFTAGEHRFDILWNGQVAGRNVQFSGNRPRQIKSRKA